MFENIGSKIKTLAKVLCWIGIIASVITAIVLWADELVGIGFIVLVGGSLLSWIGSFFAYGFGELVSNVNMMNNLMNGKEIEASTEIISRHEEKSETEETVNLPELSKEQCIEQISSMRQQINMLSDKRDELGWGDREEKEKIQSEIDKVLAKLNDVKKVLEKLQ